VLHPADTDGAAVVVTCMGFVVVACTGFIASLLLWHARAFCDPGEEGSTLQAYLLLLLLHPPNACGQGHMMPGDF